MTSLGSSKAIGSIKETPWLPMGPAKHTVGSFPGGTNGNSKPENHCRAHEPLIMLSWQKTVPGLCLISSAIIPVNHFQTTTSLYTYCGQQVVTFFFFFLLIWLVVISCTLCIMHTVYTNIYVPFGGLNNSRKFLKKKCSYQHRPSCQMTHHQTVQKLFLAAFTRY